MGNNRLDSSSSRCDDAWRAFLAPVSDKPPIACYFESRGDQYVAVMHLKFYGDDSDSHRGGNVCMLAGYLGTADNWNHFTNDWNVALAEDPSTPYFKMGANYHGDKPFKGWSEDQREKKLYRMINAFSRFGSSFVELSSCIDWETYNLLSAKVREALPHPFHICFYGVVSLVADWVHEQERDCGVTFVFDHQSNEEQQAVQTFYDVRNKFTHLRELLWSCSFANDVGVPGLQLADLIAWQVRRKLVQLPRDRGAERPELTKLRSFYRHDAKSKVASRDGLMSLCKRIEEELE